jgi:hypothetical protein
MGGVWSTSLEHRKQQASLTVLLSHVNIIVPSMGAVCSATLTRMLVVPEDSGLHTGHT